jgi:small subunit ribosomal protein S21
MIIIDVKESETLDKALKRYKKKFEKIGILKEVRRRSAYIKPSVERREVIKKAIRREKYLKSLQ